MPKLTNSLESATRKKIDLILNNLGWKTDEEKSDCNVFTERAKTKEQNSKFKGKQPDYVLYESGTDTPIAIIEAKRKGQSIEEALKQAIDRYAKPLNIDIVFAYDSTFVKSWSIKNKKELSIDGEELKELISEKILLRFIKEGTNIKAVSEKVEYTREQLIKIFDWANNLLRKEGLRNLERFIEFANILFFKLITEIEEDKEKRGEERVLNKKYCWDSFANLPTETMMEYINGTVLPYLCDKYNHSGDVFQRKLQIKNPKNLKEIVDKLSSLTLINTDSDIKGDAFEYFLKTLISGNDLGEYFTPRHIVKMMVLLVNPQFGEWIYDPTCGTGGFLIETFKHIKKSCKPTKENLQKLRLETVFGVELTNTARIAKMNMIVTGDGHTNIEQRDCLEKPIKEKYDIVLANPPYSQTTDFGNLYPCPSNKGDSIFLQHIILSLVDGGRAGVIVPEGFLFRRELKNTRKYLLENCSINAIISLPSGLFMPYTGVKTDILIFTKGKPTKKAWYFKIENDGFELNVNRRKIEGKNDIDYLLEIWEEKKIMQNSWEVDIKDIEKNDFVLLIQKNKKPKNNEIKIEDSKKLIEDAIKIENEISKELLNLKNMIK